jgi:hypothetical protein
LSHDSVHDRQGYHNFILSASLRPPRFVQLLARQLAESGTDGGIVHDVLAEIHGVNGVQAVLLKKMYCK